MKDQNIRISGSTHAALVAFIEKQNDGKVGKFADKAIREKLEREQLVLELLEKQKIA